MYNCQLYKRKQHRRIECRSYKTDFAFRLNSSYQIQLFSRSHTKSNNMFNLIQLKEHFPGT